MHRRGLPGCADLRRQPGVPRAGLPLIALLLAFAAQGGECLTEHELLCGGRLATPQPICADPDLGLVYEWVHAIEEALSAQGALIGGDGPRDALYEAAREWVIAYSRMTLPERRAALSWGNDALCGGPLVDAGPVCADAPGPVLPRVVAWVDAVGEAISDEGFDGSMKTNTDRLRRASYYLAKAAREMSPETIAGFDAGCAMKARAKAGDGWVAVEGGALTTAATGSLLRVSRTEEGWVLRADGAEHPAWTLTNEDGWRLAEPGPLPAALTFARVRE